jgi:hypothetical protein
MEMSPFPVLVRPDLGLPAPRGGRETSALDSGEGYRVARTGDAVQAQ